MFGLQVTEYLWRYFGAGFGRTQYVGSNKQFRSILKWVLNLTQLIARLE